LVLFQPASFPARVQIAIGNWQLAKSKPKDLHHGGRRGKLFSAADLH
jgi:hypothetical protein